ncbi:hypothetical protein FD06_GL000312 [Apilactobacillus ozensis DSM 23829 = JCM 17196]|uniref:Uncharacterized protein n=1 Tax=Apilactobacillus ozensis DSM 23829 = JCM 17196 TaxID=1423781 RepID=A0A0R2ARH8_9LACO|nr:DUF5388 domain-containing protein [Apilactobacillus ozensis]KRM69253.1 hypothetical protein FD06_GL000312 [Apilactobacillus ozensis DSM 23829 = JCM 17196]
MKYKVDGEIEITSDVGKSNDNKNLDKSNFSRKTTLSIDSRTKNKLQTMVLMGDAPTQKDGFEVAMRLYYDNLPDDRKPMFNMLYNSLEKRDELADSKRK